MRSIDYFDRGHDRDPNRPCIVDTETGESWTFAEVKAETERVAAAMQKAGFKSQDHVGLYGPNGGMLLIVLLAIWRVNGKWIPVNTRNAMDANVGYIDYVRCQWMFYHSSLADGVTELRSRCDTLDTFVCIDKPCSTSAGSDDPSLEQFTDGVSADDFVEPEIDAFGNLEDIVLIAPTGGTTGPSKGANVTNLGWGTMIETASDAMGGRTDNPVALVSAPITHAAGPIALATLCLGATQVILPGFDAERVLRTIEEYKVSHMYLPPTAMYQLLASPEIDKHDYSSLRIFILVGSPCSPEKLRIAVDTFGPCMCQSYGQVECPMIIAWLPPEDVAKFAREAPEKLASCGKISRSIKVALLDDDGNQVPLGEAGEICARGALVTHSYFEMPEATAEARQFGWHHTGDVGKFDEEGYLYIVDRKKDMIVSGGFNVFTAEVEAAITELAQVREAVVFGIPHEKWGEQVHATVVADGITEDEIIAHAKARLGGVKAPKTVEFVDSIPRTAAGKMDKKVLRRKYWGDSDRLVN
ncbi:AMP-binding protein [Parasphingopyxis marina]|uniref:AMP-binding protein n=1 Tax=Parasphingopyxis marina TaxID=2761622 RepID=A0A842I1M0_9SPHN|nr:AMP-binding protein [Parasphingopyxis marina]MBC2778603.1 AMP-binding protein [Parasphingopyxis marina]